MRIRSRGLFSQEMLFCCNQTTGKHLIFSDKVLSTQQYCLRKQNYAHSSCSKEQGAPVALSADVGKGDLVYIKSELHKNKSRDMYLVVGIQDNMATLQKMKGTKFLSLKYDLPLTDIYPAILPTGSRVRKYPDPVHLSSSSDDDTIVEKLHSQRNQMQRTLSTSESSATEEEDTDTGNDSDISEPRYPARERNPPQWLRSGD